MSSNCWKTTPSKTTVLSGVHWYTPNFSFKCSLLIWYGLSYIASSDRGGILLVASPTSSRKTVFTIWFSATWGKNSFRIIHRCRGRVPFRLCRSPAFWAPLPAAQTNALIVCTTPAPPPAPDFMQLAFPAPRSSAAGLLPSFPCSRPNPKLLFLKVFSRRY